MRAALGLRPLTGGVLVGGSRVPRESRLACRRQFQVHATLVAAKTPRVSV